MRILARRKVSGVYTIVLSIPVLQAGRRLTMLDTLARDLLTHAKYEPALRVVVPTAEGAKDVPNPVVVDLRDFPGLSFRLLPWNGYRNSWLAAYPAIRKVLAEEAARSEVWHTGSCPGLWDLSSLAYNVGLRRAGGLRIFCMDSDPAEMLITSRGLGRLTGRWVRTRLRRRVRHADGTIFIGRGVLERYGRDARRSVLAEAVWLQEGELAPEARTLAKFDSPGPVRLAVPSRLTAWKGVDDVVSAVAKLGPRAAGLTVDVIGEGPLKADIEARIAGAALERTVRLLPPVPYGRPFLELLRGYHGVLVPTRGQEEARVVYDAAASGCILIHSRTATLEAALGPLATRWTHRPGDPDSIAEAIASALDRREAWREGALEGLRFMRGRTIDAMHAKRAAFVSRLRRGDPAEPAARRRARGGGDVR